MAQAQTLEGLSGTGTENDPYIIASTTNWNKFAGYVNGGNTFNGKFVKLTANIELTINNNKTEPNKSDEMVGWGFDNTESKYFSGTFDGDWNTLTFNAGEVGNPIRRTDGKYPPTAPFRIIDGATIKNLTVDGTIVSSLKYNAGFVGFAFGNKTGNANNIKNCTSNIVINCMYITNSPGDDGANYKKWDCSSAGFVAENKRVNGVESKLHFENCIFYGSINQLGNENANRGAGFVSYSGPTTNKVLFNNCLMMGHIELQPLPNSSSLSTFSRPKDYITYEGTCYYANNYGNVPQTNCRLASDILEEEVSKKFTVDGEDYYVPVQITELHSMEYTSPEPLNVEVLFYGKSLIKDTDYTIVILKKDNDGVYQPATEIVGPRGAYKVTVTGKNDRGYYGESVYEFEFINEDEKWEKLVKFIDDADDGGTITLPNDFYAMDGNNALEINKNLTINLSGHQIHRNLTEPVVKGQVLRIASGKTVTINGPGTITGGYNIAESDTENGANNDGGGIYNKGILILNNVTVTHNKCIKLHEGTNAYTARGGGIFNGTGSSFSMTNGVVSHNIARGGGGGVYCEAPTSFSMTNVSISSNESESKGGGLRIRTSGNVEAALTGCTIDHNHSTATGSNRASEGGGIYMQEGHLRMENCIITYNQSAFAGAGFYAHDGVTCAKNCTITHNSAFTEHERMYGGGICLHNPSVYTMEDGTITNNHSYQDGGGIYVFQGATFNVKGNVTINENFRTRKSAEPTDTPNNAYTAGTAVINIVGDLDPKARIHITGHGFGGDYTRGMETYKTIPANFVTDGKYQKLNDYDLQHELHEIRLAPYDWFNTGTWENQPNHDDHIVPTSSRDIIVNRAIVLEKNQIGYAHGIEFSNGKLVLEDGAQLVCSINNKPEVPIEIHVQKTIEKAPDLGDDTYGWYTISLPIDNAKIKDDYENATNLVTKTTNPIDYDLLRYDEPTHYWDSYKYENYQSHFPDKFELSEKGRGYLYRNKNDVNLEFAGIMNIGDVEYRVTKSSDKLAGFNLIGNPYTHNIYKGDGAAIPNGDLLSAGFYTMTKEGVWQSKTDADEIKVCQGILVKALKSGIITMENKEGKASKASNDQIMFSVFNSKFEDHAYAVFDKGHGLDKISHFNDKAPMVYIRQNNDDYAIAMFEKRKTFNLCFKAMTTGRYTLSVKPEGNISYLHIIDRLTGEDIDMLKEHEYSFVASITDNDSRFIVRVSENDDAEESFVYQNGNDIIVTGTGELQMFDMVGRLVNTQYVNGIGIVRKPSHSGVYIFRLVGETTRAQKIFVE